MKRNVVEQQCGDKWQTGFQSYDHEKALRFMDEMERDFPDIILRLMQYPIDAGMEKKADVYLSESTGNEIHRKDVKCAYLTGYDDGFARAINSLWHDVSVRPKSDGCYFVRYANRQYGTAMWDNGDGWYKLTNGIASEIEMWMKPCQ